ASLWKFFMHSITPFPKRRLFCFFVGCVTLCEKGKASPSKKRQLCLPETAILWSGGKKQPAQTKVCAGWE
ncbi:MAG: hypothetical protein RR092_04830, partial [Oscillospiraceae bacterium]